MIDPINAELTKAYLNAAASDEPQLVDIVEILSNLNQRIIELERRSRDFSTRLTDHFRAIDQLQQKAITDLKEDVNGLKKQLWQPL